MITTAVTGISLLIKTLRDCKETIHEINQACADRSLPPAFVISAVGEGFIQGNPDYSFQGFGTVLASIIPLRVELTFWVHYRIDSPEHVELGRFSCPLQAVDTSIVDLLDDVTAIPFDQIRWGEAALDATFNDREAIAHEPVETLANVDLDSTPTVEVDTDEQAHESQSDVHQYNLRATQNTVLKLTDVPSPELSDDEKFDFPTGTTLPLVSFQAMGSHIKLTLANTTLKGRKTWVAYKEHVEVLVD